ncbi:GNAT family N-acetyltransferase [Eubacteriales bacterium OttesenSCG-928-N13]|nr:GNAT family N-acetyltransferase [Eubacteriales bacterium OttesenSCG-928-N13]
MSVTMRTYAPQALFSDDYKKVRTFLRDLNRDALVYPGFTWGRWEWMTTHSMLDRSALGQIGIWEESGRIVGLATYESVLGDAYLFTGPDHKALAPEMLSHSIKHLSNAQGLKVNIDNNDRSMQRAAMRMGFVPSNDQENTAMMDITEQLSYQLPDGFRIISMADGWDFEKYHRVMWRGFDHEGQPSYAAGEIEWRRTMLSSPTLIPEIVLAVVAPDGEYVSHCGMWYAPGDSYSLVEPVATDPAYRMMGLGKAVVIEAVKRCGQMGAKCALVGSSQQFYYNIGFYPIHTGSWWMYRKS